MLFLLIFISGLVYYFSYENLNKNAELEKSIEIKKDVYPKAAENLISMELGEAVLMFMPPNNMQFVEWMFQSNSPKINWLDDAYKTNKEGSYSSRTGLMRVNVDSVKSTILKKNNMELAWSVVLESYGNPKFGPEVITIQPGVVDGDANCFGSTTSNCTFNPFKSLSDANISAIKLCENSRKVGLRLSAKGKRDVDAVWITDGGSGGENSWLELFILNERKDICGAD